MTTVRSMTSFIDVPDGFEIADLPVLLDADAMRERINLCLPAGISPFDACALTTLRQKTSTTATIGYEMARTDEGAPVHVYARAFSRAEYDDACRRAGLTRWIPSGTQLTVTRLDDVRAILYWFPNDERLPGLRRIMVPKKLQRLFYAHFKEYPPDSWRISDRSVRLGVVRYKPERRAVLRCRFRAQRHAGAERHERFVYLGLYEPERLEELTRTLAKMHDLSFSSRHWMPAEVVGISEAEALIIWSEFEGRTLLDRLCEPGWEPDVDRCARAIAELHALNGSELLPREDPRAQLDTSHQDLLRVLPERREQVEKLVGALKSLFPQRSAPTGVAPVHGDLHAGQMLPGASRVGIIDFDRTRCGDPLEDLGNLRAQLWMGPRGGRHWDDQLVFGRFLDEYTRASGHSPDPQRLRAWTAYALFRSAAIPLGRAETDWRQRAHGALDEAGRYLT